ncbi:MAG: hypothetical protein KatS3mg015_2489 [Fimbriimonadales bacterium]|nr:MAG: hypothetical protein KatS3mg015_2489 [Fimbriimonadales bacterium]
MLKTQHRARRRSVYEDVTERIIAAIEAGTHPWQRPWIGGTPINIRSGKPYRGINVLLLGLAGYADPRWGTFRAIREAGGSVRKGEKATWVVLWKPVLASRGAEDDDGEEETQTYLLLRQYPVFNAQQADGLPPLPLAVDHDPLDRAEEIVSAYEGPHVREGAPPCYTPATDTVLCPPLPHFVSAEAYYSTLYHELVHSTGHESRLDRLESTRFGSDPYAREELVAEIGAAMLCGLAGIENLDQSAAYVNGWLSVLREDKRMIVQSAAQAQKAVDFIVGQ